MVSLLKKLLKKEKPNKSLLGFLAASATLGMFCGIDIRPASAAMLIRVDFDSGPPPPNDCSGVFGQGFDNCTIKGPTGTEFSPIIAKFDTRDPEEGEDTRTLEINSLYEDTVDGTEWSFSPSDNTPTTPFPSNASSGTWTYTPGEGDPSIKYWVAKGGNLGFSLFWMVPDDAGAACTENYSDSCLALAQEVTTGEWSTPSEQGLSHISFYNSDGGNGPEIPEPSGVISVAFIAGAMLINRWRKLS